MGNPCFSSQLMQTLQIDLAWLLSKVQDKLDYMLQHQHDAYEMIWIWMCLFSHTKPLVLNMPKAVTNTLKLWTAVDCIFTASVNMHL